MNVRHPFSLDSSGRTARDDEDSHIRALIEQVLFTDPGERVNRPEFGSNLRQMVFGGLDEETAAATQFLVQGALQRWLGDRIQVEAVEVRSQDTTLEVTVQYRVNRSQELQVAQFTS